MKKTQIITAVIMTAILALANSAWAATFESLADYSKAPQVKKFSDAWKQCGPNGDSCPDEKSAAEAIRLRKQASINCFETFGENDYGRVDPCKAAIAATPSTFSVKVGSKVKPTAKPPIVVDKPTEPKPEPDADKKTPFFEANPYKNENLVTSEELEKKLNAFLLNEIESRVLKERSATPPQPPTPSNNLPGWMLFLVLWNFAIGILSLGAVIHLRKKMGKPSEAPPAENAKAQALREKSMAFQCQLELEQQMLDAADPQRAAEMEERVETLKLLKGDNDNALEQLVSEGKRSQ